MPKILAPLMTDFEEIEFVTVVDILRRAGVEVVTAGLSPNPIMGAHGIAILADTSLDAVSPDSFDGVFLPGGKGTTLLRQDERVGRIVRAIHDRGKLTAAICAAPTVLSDLGLLGGRRATSHPTKAGEMVAGQYLVQAVVQDDHVYTSRGAGTAVALALELAARVVGAQKALEVAAAIVSDWQPATEAALH